MNPEIDIDFEVESKKVESNNATERLFWDILQYTSLSRAGKGSFLLKFGELSVNQKRGLFDEIKNKTKNKDEILGFLNYYFFKGGKEKYLRERYESVYEGYRNVDIGEIHATTIEEQPVKQIETKPKKREYASLKELNKLIGLEKTKSQVHKLIAHTEIKRLREQYNLKSKNQSLHMMFKGNPGTGKTTVARLLGSIFKEIGILSEGHVVEIDRSSVVSMYQGEIERKMRQYVDEAEGGILFIDEIYGLFDTKKDDDQGKHGITTLLKLIEDKRENFICIGTGYTKEVDEFLNSNPGLLSRFSIHIDFDDYNEEELLNIAADMFIDQDYEMKEDFKEKFIECIREEKEKENFGNGRVVRNIVESAIREQALRLFNSEEELGKEDLMSIIKDDFKYEPVELTKDDEESDMDIRKLTKLIRDIDRKEEKAI